MNSNKFSKKMSSKSDAELENIIINREKYTQEALQAVLWEIENRKPENKKVLSSNILDNEVSTPKKEGLQKITYPEKESHFDEFEKPILYSKTSIKGFSIFFGTIFGAVLLMSNLSNCNKSKEKNYVLLFGIVYTLFTYAIIFTIGSNFIITLILNCIGFGILTEFFWNKYLGKSLNYSKKRIVKPLLISLAIMLSLIFLQFLPEIFGDTL